MQSNPNRFSGILFIVAAVTFLLGWVLMPDAGTNDAEHVLAAVSLQRASVWWSVVAHMISGMAFACAVITAAEAHLHTNAFAKLGAVLIGIGGIGVCIDGIFHLVAFYMTADEVTAQGALSSMRQLQTQGLAFLVPLLLSLFAGGIVYAVGLRRAGITTWWPTRIFLTALGLAVVGGAIAAGVGQGRRMVVLGFFALVALGYVWLGFELITRRTFRSHQHV